MSLLLLEGCDVGFDRWLKTGNLIHSELDGLDNQRPAFIFPSAKQKFENKIVNRFKPETDAMTIVGQRKFRLSFWIRIDGNLTENTEFITLSSSSENMGGSIGLNTDGRFYVGHLTENSEWKDIWAKCDDSQPSILDNKTHFVEFDIHWDTWEGSPVIIWVDGIKYCDKRGRNTLSDTRVWSAPNIIEIGNLIGCNLILDDIILWDDSGNYLGPKGPKKINTSIPKDFHKYADRNVHMGENLFETHVSSTTRAGIVSMVLSHDPGKFSVVCPVVKISNDYIRGAPINLMSDSNHTLKMVLDQVNVSNIWVGIEKYHDT